MSVVEQIVVESRRYSGWADPRYPEGYWQASLNGTGDATGGILAIDLVFQEATAVALNSQMYSVERIAIVSFDTTSREVRVFTVNMGGPSNQGFTQQYTVSVVAETAMSRGAIHGDQLTFLPWFLGSQRLAAITASLSIFLPNVDGLIVAFEAEGYRWGARSVLVDGGPQRPPTGPYRS